MNQFKGFSKYVTFGVANDTKKNRSFRNDTNTNIKLCLKKIEKNI